MALRLDPGLWMRERTYTLPALEHPVVPEIVTVLASLCPEQDRSGAVAG